MKQLVYIAFLSFILLSSCSITQRHYMPGFYLDKPAKNTPPLAGEKQETSTEAVSKSIVTEQATTKEQPQEIIATEENTLAADSACDVILLKNGSKVEGKITEVNSYEIKFRKCNYPDGPLIIIPRSRISAIHYADGTKEVFKTGRSNTGNKVEKGNGNTGKIDRSGSNTGINGNGKNVTLAVASLVTGVIGIFLVPLLGSVAAIILGFAALARIAENPEEYGGKGMAVAGITLGFLGILLIVLLLGFLLSLFSITI